MSAPASVHQTARRRAQLIIEREYVPDPARCVKAIIALLTYRPPAANDAADDRRPLGAGARPRMHEDRTSAGKHDGAALEEDGRHEPTDV